MKIFGHPLHIMLIHFPVGLLPMEFVLSALAYTCRDPMFTTAAFYCGVGGVVECYIAMLTGLLDLVAILKENKLAIGTGLLHGFINGLVVLVYTIFVYKTWQAYPKVEILSLTALLIKGLLVGCLLFGNFLGGRLIYQYHIGINKK